MHADDQWTYVPEKDGKRWEVEHVETEEERKVGKAILEQGLVGNQAALVQERMLKDYGEIQERLVRAMEEMKEDGPSYLHQVNLMNDIAARVGEEKLSVRPKRGDGIATWGNRIPLGDCEVQEVAIGKLHFRAVDFGDTIRLSEKSRKELENIEPHEKNQCVLIHAVAGTQRHREGRKNGVPTLARVLMGAEEWRKEEYAQAKQAMERSEGALENIIWK